MIWKIQHFSEQTQYFNWNTSVNMNAYGILWAFTDSIAINHRGHSKLKKSFKQTVFIFYTLYHPTPDTILLLYQNPEPYALIIVSILFTSSADFLIHFLATSSQIAGTVNTQWISPSCSCGTRSLKFRNRWSFKNFIPPLNTWIAGNSLPV